MSGKLILTRGQVAIIDAADHAWLSQWKWSAVLCSGRFYAMRGQVFDGRMKGILLHRFIMGAENGQTVDHINRDQLDDRRENLRFCSLAENAVNRCGNLTGRKTSRFKGVYWQKDIERWRARFQLKYLGTFRDEETAARAYDLAAYAAFPDHAFLNFAKESVSSAVYSKV